MEKIVNYIKFGKGNGLLFLLATTVLITIFWLLFFKQFYNDFRPQLISVAEQITPITVQDGRIVKPEDTYKRLELKIGDDTSSDSIFPVVLDTREPVSELPKEKVGLFIMSDVVYLIAPTEIKKVTLKDGVWTLQSVEEFLNYFSGVISMVISVVMIAVLFGLMLIKTLIAAALGKWAVKKFSKIENINFDTFMRLGALLLCAIEIVCVGLVFFMGLHVGWLLQVLIAILFIFLFFNKDRKLQN